ncbi:LysM peptidoglycan-binding domain-containing protein [Nocardioides limicola]|uniref:LysM peptidoglycan-binding domain-containing protein n=1 Tax=Nocardioides limicola TaxID=2803368 RepID=UPI00193BBDDE|nr:LysM peptidoglycan-binding domain-containing protein [Nocardioides sp. DJM-14]
MSTATLIRPTAPYAGRYVDADVTGLRLAVESAYDDHYVAIRRERAAAVRSIAPADGRAGGLVRGELRLTRRGRLVVFLAALGLVLAAVFFAASSVATGDTGEVAPTETVRVLPGDTLWVIAKQITPAGEDVRVTVERLMRLNELDSASLQVGQRLLVPVE